MHERHAARELRLHVGGARVRELDGAETGGAVLVILVRGERHRERDDGSGLHIEGLRESYYSTTKKRPLAPATFVTSAAVLYGLPALNFVTHAGVAPGTVIRSASLAVFAFIGMNVY
jgi:hypothetical protein